MSRTIDYYTSLISPWAYLGSRRIEAIAAKHGAELDIKPVDLAQIFPESGGLPLAKRAPQRQAYRLVELARWRDYLQVPLTLRPKHFPMPESLAARMVTACRQEFGAKTAVALGHACLQAVWAEDENIADPNVLCARAAGLGLQGERLLERAEAADVIAAYQAQTKEAFERGVFGAPTYFIDGEMFWGQDRLDFVDRALARA